VSLCLAGGGAVAKLALAAFTLAWTHTVQHTAWAEDWQVTPAGLEITAARVQGSGAGMDPGPDAVRVGDSWQWHPKLGPLPQIVLRREPVAGDWHLCHDGHCRPFADLVPADADPVRLYPCE
jgi:hypothetical protein